MPGRVNIKPSKWDEVRNRMGVGGAPTVIQITGQCETGDPRRNRQIKLQLPSGAEGMEFVQRLPQSEPIYHPGATLTLPAGEAAQLVANGCAVYVD